ncbi:chalcone isomerase family protein [Grimontia kaedaensis]|nr:chalcone isomerase family protein [Grimontia kaedaensis]
MFKITSFYDRKVAGRKRIAALFSAFVIALTLSTPITASPTGMQTAEDWVWWKPVGAASLTWGFWKIYDSELRTPSGEFEPASGEPLALVITYSRDIDADDLLDATVEQWEHLGFSEQQTQEWLPQMQNAWPDVKEGDRLIYVLSEDQGQFFYQPEQGKASPYGKLRNADIANAFSAIWLSPATAYPSLRLALIGGNPE